MTHERHRVTLGRSGTLRTALLGCSLALAAPAVATAQGVRIIRTPDADHRIVISTDDRPMIGITTVAESERGDTLGLRIESVRAGSPAEKAGLRAGDRLQSANGTSLRADRADAGEDDYDGVLTRRLQRVVQTAKPGDAIALKVLSGTAVRDVSVTPVKASTLEDEGGDAVRVMRLDDDRAVLGLAVTGTASLRDTLGVFVQSVAKDGPAEKAGIYEGDRIAAINGVSLRVPREDAEDESVGSARAERLAREMAKLNAGDAAELTIVTAGRSRTVRVTTVKASELPASEGQSFFMRSPGGLMRLHPGMPEMPGMFEMPRMPELREMPAMPRMKELDELPMRRLVPGMRLKLEPRAGPLRIRQSIITSL